MLTCKLSLEFLKAGRIRKAVFKPAEEACDYLAVISDLQCAQVRAGNGGYPGSYQQSSMRSSWSRRWRISWPISTIFNALKLEQAKEDKSGIKWQQRFKVRYFLTYELVGSTILRCTQRSSDRRVCCIANSRLRHIKFGVHLKSWVPSSSSGWQDTKVGTTLNWQENSLWQQFKTVGSQIWHVEFWVHQNLDTPSSGYIKLCGPTGSVH